MPHLPNSLPRSFASVRALQEQQGTRVRELHRGLDDIPELPMHMTRRGIVSSFLVGLGGLTVGCSSTGKTIQKAAPGASAADSGSSDITTDTDTGTDTGLDTAPIASFDIGVWVTIATEDAVTVTIVKNEMGQGIATGMAMVVAEELDADWEQVRVVLAADLDDTDLPGGSNGTWGSTSMSDSYRHLRAIGAAARAVLVEAAAAEWGVSAESLSTTAGTVTHPDHGSLRYGALAEAAGALELPRSPTLKDESEFTIIGQDTNRVDIEDHLHGRTVYGMDVVVDNMLHAAVLQCPVFGGEVANLSSLSVDGTAATAVCPIPNGVAVVAESWWVAKSVLAGLSIEWETPVELDGVSSDDMTDDFRSRLDGATTTRGTSGDVDAALSTAAVVLEAEFGAPMLAHAPMEPMVCTAHVQADQCEVWTSTQYAEGVRFAASSVTGLRASQIQVHPMALGGGFGRKAETDFAIQAVTLSQQMGRPVKVIWTREEEIRHGYYRPPVEARITGALDDAGRIVAWRGAASGTSFFSATAGFNLTGFDDFAYDIPNKRVAWAGATWPIPFGYLRGPGHNKFNFMVETFMDELAEAAGVDPVAFRLQHLEGEARSIQVLERVAELADWGNPTVPGAQHGCALTHWGTASLVAQVAEVSIDTDGTVHVHRVWAVADVGRVIHPDLVRSQIEGSVLYSLSSGLFGEITLTDGAVDQSNFHDYPVLRMRRAPEVTTELVDSTAAPGGVGELAVGGIIPAVLNAMARVDGRRTRSLPITRHGYL